MDCNFKCIYYEECEDRECNSCNTNSCRNCMVKNEKCELKGTRLDKHLKEEISKEGLLKEDLIKLCEKNNIKINKRTSKLLMLDNLLNAGVTYFDMYNEFSDKVFGIHPSRFSNKFKVNSYQRKKMEKQGFIQIAYLKREKIMSGIYGDIPYYNPKWYFNLNETDIEEWRIKNIRGYKEKQLEL